MSAARIYVGHLSHKARERDVEDFFSRYGRIREILLKNGFGFVEFDDARDAEEAVYRCNGKELRGERVIVEMTKRPPKGRDMFRSGRFPPYGGGRGGNFHRSPPRRREMEYSNSHKYKLIVENLSTRISWQDLKDLMRSAGEVIYADAHRARRNEGIVCFSCAADLKKALDTLDGKELNGRKIKLTDASRGRSRSRTRSSRSASSSRSRSGSRSRSRSARSRSRSAKSSRSSRSKSKSRSRSSRSHSKSAAGSRSRSRSGSAGRKSPRKETAETNGGRKSRSKSRSGSRSASRSVSGSPVAKNRSSRSASPRDENGRPKSDMEED